MSLSTHVLDAVTGRPAAGVDVRVEAEHDSTWSVSATGQTDGDGRIGDLGHPAAGIHRITFGSGAYFRRLGVPTFYPEVAITFQVTDADAHHHVPLLLSPYAFSTYRGS